jgi:glutamine cyclotransferase
MGVMHRCLTCVFQDLAQNGCDAIVPSLQKGARRILCAFLFWSSMLLAQTARVDSYRVVATYPHAKDAFTQGLEYVDGHFYEGTGLNGESTIRIVTPATGVVVKKQAIDYMYFGEGITVFAGKLYELTWQNSTALVYDAKTFQRTGEFHYTGEGWGLTHDGKQLIMSDGTPSLRFLDPVTFKESGRVYVRDGSRAVTELNELEYIEGEIWANVWQTERIARINPQTGLVNSWVDLAGLLKPSEQQGVDVLNGIAYDAKGKRIFVTGKKWPKMFEIQVVPGKSR